MAKTVKRPMGEGEPLYAKPRRDDSIHNLLAVLRGESVDIGRDNTQAEREADFYGQGYDAVVAVNPELTVLPQDDSQIIKDFFQRTSVEAAKEEPCSGHPQSYPLKKYPSF